ncbi:MAG: porin family protein [Porphyromonas sp.]|nr:porin family protein [Porphyromonas sp.]
MRKVFSGIVIALVSLLAINTADAQLRWGIKAGGNFTKASMDVEKMSSEYLTAFHAGPTVEIGLGAIPLAVEGSILFSQKGTKLDTTEDLKGVGEGFLKTNNIEVPIYAKYYFNVLPTIAKVFVMAGPSFNFNINSTLTDAYENPALIQGLEAKRFGVGLNAGIGVQLLKYLQVSAAYNASLTNDYQYKSIGQSTKDFLDAKNKGFSVTATLLF